MKKSIAALMVIVIFISILTANVLPYKVNGVTTHYFSISDCIYMDIIEGTTLTFEIVTTTILGGIDND